MMLLWHAAAIVGGSSTGLLGVYVVGLRMPFLGVGLAHAAMAGAVIARLLGLPQMPVALGFCLAAGIIMARIATTEHTRTDLGTITGILLSLMMGLAFLGMGLNRGELTPILGLMWGSLLFVRPGDVILMVLLGLLLAGFVIRFRRPLEAVLFSRQASRLSGINERSLLSGLMVVAALVVTLNLQVVGGLMMYSLLTNPAAAAYEFGRSMRQVRIVSTAFGVVSTVGGFWLSWWFDAPTGACIVISSTLLYAAVVWLTSQGRAGRSATSPHGEESDT